MILLLEINFKVSGKAINTKEQSWTELIEASLEQVIWAEPSFSSHFAYLHANASNIQSQTSKSIWSEKLVKASGIF